MVASDFVDRTKELQHLSTCFDQLEQDQFSLVFISGAAGSGKTALVGKFEEMITQQHPETIVGRGFCNAQTGWGDPYLPFRGILDELLEDVDEKKEKQDGRSKDILKNMFVFSTRCIVEFAPDLIDTFVPGGKILSGLSKLVIKETQVTEKLKKLTESGLKNELEESRIQEQYTHLLQALSEEYKLLLILDDLQWADDSSIALLYHLAQSLRGHRIMLVGLYRKADVSIGREGKRHPLGRVKNELQRIYGDCWLDLDELDLEDRIRFTQSLIDLEPNSLDENFRNALFEITDGNALFTRELLLNLKENGSLVKDENGVWVENETIDWSVIPPKVEGVIKERINRLEDFLRHILCIASVQGKNFLAQAISRILKTPDRDLVRQLSAILDKQHRLVREGRAQRLGGQILSYFCFTDSVIQHYLYSELSESEKMLFSQDIAQVLEGTYGEQVDEIAVELAHLYQVAVNHQKTAVYANKAGKKAFCLSAYQQAIQHLRLALQSIEQLPDNDENRKLKLDTLIHLSLSLKPIEGWADRQVFTYYRQAVDLGYTLKAFKQISPMIFGLWASYLMKLELQKAEKWALKYQELGHRLQAPEILLQADLALSNTAFWMGKIEGAYHYARDFFRVYDPDAHANQLEKYGQDPATVAMLFAGLSLSMLGDIVGTNKVLSELVALAESLAHPFSLAIALQTGAYIGYHLSDFAMVNRYADQLLEVSEKHGFIFYIGLAKMFKGIVLGKQGEYKEAITLIDEGYLEDVGSDGTKLLNSLYGLLIADVAIWSKQYAYALETIEKVQQIACQSHEMCYFSELLRLKGKALFASGETQLAHTTLLESLQNAQETKIVTMELKTLLDLAKMENDKRHVTGMIKDCLNRFISTMEYTDIALANQFIARYNQLEKGNENEIDKR